MSHSECMCRDEALSRLRNYFEMAPIRYSLHYEDYSEHLMSRFGKLLQMQSLVDMTLMCSSHTLRVHKAVLAASSAYFQEVLQKQTGEPLIILKMRFSVLKCLVEFMYCGKTQCLEENLDELVSAAQFLKIKGLSKVTKEGLGIANSSEVPIFTPPVVINRPPQSLIDLHSQDDVNNPQSSAMTNQPHDNMGRAKDTVVRIPFDIENGGSASSVDYTDTPRTIKPRRGRPSQRPGWENSGSLGRAAERALLRREQDSRKVIHQLKHLQTRHMQDYMDRVTLSQAVSSICGPDSSSNYLNIDNDLMYMDQTGSSNVLDPYTKEHPMSSETITSYSNANTTNSANESDGIGTAMSQYVNALKNAGLPTDLPILFESGDGSYINVNEQVLLDMVQSSEIQYEVIEQPNIIEKVADPSEIKSIDDLSKSIERGEMLLGNKDYGPNSDYAKDSPQYNRTEDAINSLTALPDNLDSFTEQQHYVVLDSRLNDNNNTMDNTNDFSCIDGDMQFFTKSMSDDVKKYYEDQHLNDDRDMEQLCPSSTSLDTNFNISLLNTKISNLTTQYNTDDLRRNDDCYDFGLPLPQGTDFKDPLDCLMATPKRSDDQTSFDDSQLEQRAQERDEIIKDLMNIENKINMAKERSSTDVSEQKGSETPVTNDGFNVNSILQDLENESNNTKELGTERNYIDDNINTNLPDSIPAGELQWDHGEINSKAPCKTDFHENNTKDKDTDNQLTQDSPRLDSVLDLTEPANDKSENWGTILSDDKINNKSEEPQAVLEKSTVTDNIPFAVGLLPLNQVNTNQTIEEPGHLKRKSIDTDIMDNVDAKCLKRKVKYKKL